MNHLIFVLKTAAISTFICSLLGILGGLIWNKTAPLHAHVPIPAWLITFVVAACTALVIGILVGSTLSFLGKANLTRAILYTIGIATFFLIVFLVYVINL